MNLRTVKRLEWVEGESGKESGGEREKDKRKMVELSTRTERRHLRAEKIIWILH